VQIHAEQTSSTLCRTFNFDVCSAKVGGSGKCSYFVFNEESNIELTGKEALMGNRHVHIISIIIDASNHDE
jgi:hypothetical protein